MLFSVAVILDSVCEEKTEIAEFVVYLIKARDTKEADKLAIERALKAEVSYKNVYNQSVQVKFKKIHAVYEIFDKIVYANETTLTHGAELFSMFITNAEAESMSKKFSQTT